MRTLLACALTALAELRAGSESAKKVLFGLAEHPTVMPAG
jgi:hypothetical protein